MTFNKSITKINDFDEPFFTSFVLDLLVRFQYPFFLKTNMFFVNQYKEIQVGGGLRTLPPDSIFKIDLYITFGGLWTDANNILIHPTHSFCADFKILLDNIFFTFGAGYKGFDRDFTQDYFNIQFRFLIGFYF